MNFSVLRALVRRFPHRAVLVAAAVLFAVGLTMFLGKPGAGVGIGMLGLLLLEEHLQRLAVESALRDLIQLMAEMRGRLGVAVAENRRLKGPAHQKIIQAAMSKTGKKNARMN